MKLLEKIRSLEIKKRWFIALVCGGTLTLIITGGVFALRTPLGASASKNIDKRRPATPGKILRDELDDSRRTLLPAIGGLKGVIRQLSEEAKKQQTETQSESANGSE